MTTYGAQVNRKWTGSEAEVDRKWTKIGQKVNAKDLQAQDTWLLKFDMKKFKNY